MDHPILLMWSKVKTLFQLASHAKKLTLGSTQEFQITLAGIHKQDPIQLS